MSSSWTAAKQGLALECSCPGLRAGRGLTRDLRCLCHCGTLSTCALVLDGGLSGSTWKFVFHLFAKVSFVSFPPLLWPCEIHRSVLVAVLVIFQFSGKRVIGKQTSFYFFLCDLTTLFIAPFYGLTSLSRATKAPLNNNDQRALLGFPRLPGTRWLSVIECLTLSPVSIMNEGWVSLNTYSAFIETAPGFSFIGQNFKWCALFSSLKWI